MASLSTSGCHDCLLLGQRGGCAGDWWRVFCTEVCLFWLVASWPVLFPCREALKKRKKAKQAFWPLESGASPPSVPATSDFQSHGFLDFEVVREASRPWGLALPALLCPGCVTLPTFLNLSDSVQ